MPKRRPTLFLQIFIWFWAAMALLAATMVGVELATRQEPLALASRALAERALKAEAAQARAAWRKGGQTALAAELDGFNHDANVESFLLTPGANEDLAGHPLPVPVLRAVSKLDSQHVAWTVAGVSVQAALPAGPDAIFAVQFERGPFAGSRLPRLIRLFAIIVVAGLVCWFLAARLTSPITALRAATQQLAAGDLGARANLARTGAGMELTGLAGDFNAMATQIESLVTAQRRLVGDVSHELRSPLTRLKIALALANRDAESSSTRDHLARMEQETATLDELVGELLLLSRLENRLEPGQVTAFNWADVVAEVCSDLKWEAENRLEELTIHCDIDVAAAPLHGEAALLKRALENIGRNALRYAPPGGDVTLSLHSENGQHKTIVRDNGPGVPEGELEAIFRPFYRVDTARERSQDSPEGTGLGLAIAARAVQLHGGTITARNLSTGGLEVVISLPALR